MDNLPVELRFKIFRDVLRANVSLVRAKEISHGSPPAKKMDTALFTVNRQVFQEAQDAFYEANIISSRIRYPDYTKLQLARHLMYYNVAHTLAIGNLSGFESSVLEVFRQLPRLRALTISGERICLKELTMREHLAANGLQVDLKAHDIGLLEVVPTICLSGRIWIKHFFLVKTIPQARSLALSLTIDDLYFLLIRKGLDDNAETDVASKETFKLAFWLRCYEGMRQLKRDPSFADTLSDQELSLVSMFGRGECAAWVQLRTTSTVPAQHEQLPDEVALLDLSLHAGHSPELLERLTELLALNLEWIAFGRTPA